MGRALLITLVWVRRLVLIGGWSAVLLAILAAVAGWWLTATPGGVQWTLAQAERQLPALSIGESRGTFWRGLELEQLEWTPEDGATAAIGQARLRLDPVAIWRSGLHFPEVAVRDVHIDLPADDPSAPAGEPFDLDDLSLPPVSLAIERLRVDRLVVVQGDRRYEVSRARLSVLLDARVERPRLEMDIDELALRLPDGVRLDARAAVALEPAGKVALIGHAEFLLDHPQGWLSGQIEADGDLLGELDLRPRLAWMGANGLPAALCGRLQLDQETLTIEQLSADVLGGRMALSGVAGWAPTGRVELTGRGESLNPAWVSPGTPGSLDFDIDADLQVADGWLPVAGRLSVTDLAGQLAGESIEAVDVDLLLDDTQVEARISGQAGGGVLRLDAQLDAERYLQADWQIDALPLAGGAQGAPPVHLASRGRLDAELPDWNQSLTGAEWLSSVRARLEDGRLELVERRDDGQRRAVTLEMGATLDAGRLAVERLDLDAPGTTLAASGALDLDPDWAQWRLDGVQGKLAVPDLAALPWDLFERLPGVDLAPLQPETARGAIHIDVDASGPILAPQGQFEARIDALRLAGYSLDRAQATAVIDPADEKTALTERRMQVSLEAGAFAPHAGEALFDRLSFAVEGRPSAHQLTLDVDGPVEVRLVAQGGWQSAAEKMGWQGQLTGLDLGLPAGDPWRLRAPAELSVSPASQRLESLCMQPVVPGLAADAVGSLCLSGERAGEIVTAQVDGDLALQALWQQWPGHEGAAVEWPGRVSVTAEARLDEASRSANVDLRLPPSEIRFTGRDDLATDVDREVITYPETRLTASLADEQVEAALQGGLEDWLVFDGQGEANLDDGTLDGAFSLEEAELARLFDLADRLVGPLDLPISDLAGSLSGQLAVSGRLDAPRLSGRLLGEGLAFASLPTGTEYQDGSLELSVEPDGALRLTADLLGEAETPPRPVFSARRVDEVESPRSRGRIRLEGNGHLAAFDDWRLEAELGGEAVPILRLPTLAVDARPAITFDLAPDGGRLDGAIYVPLAIANLGELPESARGNSEDLVIVGEEVDEPGSAYPLTGDIEVILGDQVSLRGEGFATRLTGGLEMRMRPGESPGAFGEIRLEDGRYEIYGQTLAVERGRLIFTGPLTAPGLDVVATREINDDAGTVVGLSIAGQLESPETEVFSRPPTSPSDALSLLLTGRRLSAGSDADASLLLNAIAGLGIRQGDDLAQQVNSVFGFDEIGLTSDGGVGGTRLSVGKRIGDNLLVRYAVGVFDGVGEVITRYRINKFLHLEFSSSTESQSGDLIYQIDRGRPED
ncbi:translocation/assembly module TamB domain-containing protein [Guyparkeria sp. GHLCS8-2]|uniref:translocation/assembly module TamB domain-containing protein n=1 Tax=Guyparkeria halopsychrophila TaxID=3139421 RepID=UPI0037CA14C1